MIKVNLSTNTDRTSVIVEDSQTPSEIFSDNSIDFNRGQVYLDGVQLSASEMNTNLSDLGVTESCRLSVVIKADNN